MDNIKALMGSAYHEGVTIEEVNSFLAGKKMVNLNDGGFVAKDKYENLESKHKTLQSEHDTLKEQTKDYETLKKENDGFKSEKANAELKEKVVKYGIKESYFKYVKGDIDSKELELGEDEKVNEANVKKYLEAHPEFAESAKPKAPHKEIVITTKVGDDKKPDSKEMNQVVNDNIRAALGISEN